MYRIELVPRGTWMILVIAGLLILLMAFSIAMSKSRTEVIFIGPEVKTGNPADYIKKPVPPPSTIPGPVVTPPPVVTPANPPPTPTPPPMPKLPAGLPQSLHLAARHGGSPEGWCRST